MLQVHTPTHTHIHTNTHLQTHPHAYLHTPNQALITHAKYNIYFQSQSYPLYQLKLFN